MEELFNKLSLELGHKLSFLEDKPEETVDTTLKSLWHKASGSPKSAKAVSGLKLPKLSDEQVALLHQLIDERLNGKPLAYITGRQSFMGIEFKTDFRALIPRNETEILAGAALKLCSEMAENKPIIKVFDVCCGSGNIGLALASSIHNTIVHSSDLSDDAVELTKENISFLNLHHKVDAVQSDLFSSYESHYFYNKVDVIVCNPPYISTSKVANMHAEISANEPLMAFDGGMIGFRIIQKLIHESPRFLSGNGWVVFEIGVGQGPFIHQLCENNKSYDKIETFYDHKGNIRAIAARNSK